MEEAWSKLSDSDKGILLRNLWDFAVVKLGNDEEVTVDEVYNNIYASLEGKDIISTDPVPGDGKISEGAVKIIIQKLLIISRLSRSIMIFTWPIFKPRQG